MRIMATYFGEILGVSSRAVDDDEIGQESPQKLEFRTIIDPKVKKYYFGIFAFGKVAINFIHNYFLSENAEVLASASIAYPTSDDCMYSGLNYSKKPKEVARVFTSSENENILICEVEDTLPDHLSVELCENVLQFCEDTSEAMIFVNQPLYMYQGNETAEGILLRCLISKQRKLLQQAKGNVVLGCANLEEPNIITNFPAAVLTHYEVFKKAAVLYVCYSEADLDSEVMSIFKNIFNLPTWQHIKKVPNAEQRLSQVIKDNYKYISNLYT